MKPWMRRPPTSGVRDRNETSDRDRLRQCTNAWTHHAVHPDMLAKNSEGKIINPHQKPLWLLTDLISRHMRGPESLNRGNGAFNESYDGVIPVDYPKKKFHWILDACCGSGSTSVAANKLGMASVAFDK